MSWGGGDRSQQDLWAALVTVAEAESADLEFLMVRLQDSDLEKIRQAAQAALVASSRLQAAEREAAVSNPAKAVPKQVATGATDAAQVAPAAGLQQLVRQHRSHLRPGRLPAQFPRKRARPPHLDLRSRRTPRLAQQLQRRL